MYDDRNDLVISIADQLPFVMQCFKLYATLSIENVALAKNATAGPASNTPVKLWIRNSCQYRNKQINVVINDFLLPYFIASFLYFIFLAYILLNLDIPESIFMLLF